MSRCAGPVRHKGNEMRVKNWVKTVPTLVVIGTVLFLVLTAGSGLLLYAWGWSVVAEIALWVGYAAILAAATVLLALIAGFLAHERAIKHAAATGPTSPVAREPVVVG